MKYVSRPAQGLWNPWTLHGRKMIKFASMPLKYAPKRKMVNFSLPKWRNKLGEIYDADIEGFINTLYQDRTFKTQKEFNEAYDNRLLELLHWQNKPMILTREDVTVFETDHRNGAFDTTKPEVIDKLLTKIKACFETGEKVIFVY
jgi:hypothetical protein